MSIVSKFEIIQASFIENCLEKESEFEIPVSLRRQSRKGKKDSRRNDHD